MNRYQFTFKENPKDGICKDFKVDADTASEALKAFQKANPNGEFIAMWDNTKL